MRLGSDPEVFLLTNQLPKSVCGLIGADKWNPLQVDNMPEGFTFQEDNVALEFGVPPASNANEFVAHIQAVQSAFLQRYKGLSFSKLSCIVFPDSEMNHPMAHIFGCEPDFNAWTGLENKKPSPPVKNMRSAGGHVHVETQLDKHHVIQAMDLALGVPSVLMDTGKARRQLYGAAGAHRPKSYGVEYRTLSNFWIFDEKLIRWIWRNTATALESVAAGVSLKEFQHDIESCINNSDEKADAHLVKMFNLEVV